MMVLGKFIVFEGLDGSGQSTQVGLIAKKLREKGLNVHTTKEPTNNIIGGLVRSQLTKDWVAPQTCLQLLFAADRAHHLEKEIVPALEKGWIVLSDRYMLSSMAFGSLDVDVEWLKKINENFLIPDMTFWLTTPPDICLARITSNRLGVELFEEHGKLKSVWKSYESLSKDHPSLHTIDGTRSPEVIASEIMGLIDQELKLDQLAKNMKWFLNRG